MNAIDTNNHSEWREKGPIWKRIGYIGDWNIECRIWNFEWVQAASCQLEIKHDQCRCDYTEDA